METGKKFLKKKLPLWRLWFYSPISEQLFKEKVTNLFKFKILQRAVNGVKRMQTVASKYIICIRPIAEIQALIAFVSSNKQAKHQPNFINFGQEVAKHDGWS